ncbi:MAG: LysR family transcriptional regulator [Pseudomonadota bacterium]
MLKELRTFLAVARHGTFSRAGARVGLTQSAVSAQIRRLEASLGFPLFDRQGRVAVLNAAGRATLANAEQLVGLFEKLQHTSAAEGEADAVRLDIGAIASVQAARLPDAMAALHAGLPHLRLRVVPGVSLGMLGMVDAGTLDAAVMIRPPFAPPAELAWHTLWTEPFVLLVPAAIKGRDWRALLLQHPFLRYDRTSFGGRLVTQFLQAHGIAVRDVVEMDELAGIVRLVANGLGVALVPRCRPYFPLPEGVRCVELGSAGFDREIGLLERAQHGRMGMVKALAQALRAAR